MSEIDRSPEAIDRRLRTLSELYDLGISLLSARRIGPVASPPSSEASPPAQERRKPRLGRAKS